MNDDKITGSPVGELIEKVTASVSDAAQSFDFNHEKMAYRASLALSEAFSDIEIMKKMGESVAEDIFEESQIPGQTRLMMEYMKNHPGSSIYTAASWARMESERLRTRLFIRREVRTKLAQYQKEIGPQLTLSKFIGSRVESVTDAVMTAIRESLKLVDIPKLDVLIPSAIDALIQNTGPEELEAFAENPREFPVWLGVKCSCPECRTVNK